MKHARMYSAKAKRREPCQIVETNARHARVKDPGLMCHTIIFGQKT